MHHNYASLARKQGRTHSKSPEGHLPLRSLPPRLLIVSCCAAAPLQDNVLMEAAQAKNHFAADALVTTLSRYYCCSLATPGNIRCPAMLPSHVTRTGLNAVRDNGLVCGSVKP